MSEPVIRVENLGKKYIISHQQSGQRYKALRDVLAGGVKSLFSPRPPKSRQPSREEFWALKDVSFEIKRGTAVGIIGRNGAGKSTLLKLLSRITEPTRGRIEIDGRMSSLLEVGTGFHPELTGRENIFLNGAILGMRNAEIKQKFDELVAFAEIEKFLDTPVKRYSSGMYMRLAFAVAAHLEPDILVIDEVLAVGDSQFQKKCLGKMQSVSESEGRTVLLVSHNMQAIGQLCTEVVVLQNGSVAHVGDTRSGINLYLNQVQHDHGATTDLNTYPRRNQADGARLVGLTFSDEEGQAVSSLAWQTELSIELKFRVERTLKQLDLAIAVMHTDGSRVFSEVYSDQFPKMTLEPGEYSVQLSMPMRFFKMESYFLAAGLYDEGRHCDFVEGFPLPAVLNDQADPTVESVRWGVMRLPVNWAPVTKREK